MNVLVVDTNKEVIEMVCEVLRLKQHNPIVSNFYEAPTKFLTNEIGTVVVNANPSYYSEIFDLKDTVDTVTPSIPFYVSAVLDFETQIHQLKDQGAQVINPLQIINTLITL